MPVENLIGVAIIALGMVMTPGPIMVYLTSRAISQGRLAGMISLAGVALGFGCYLVASGLGLAALFKAFPMAYYVVRIGGAFYLGYLAWNMFRGASPFQPRELPPHSPRKLFTMGLVTNLLNPKIALMYSALIPQFIDPSKGSTLQQYIQLGLVQISIALTLNGLIVLAAARVSRFLTARPNAMRAHRWASGALLGVFAIDILVRNPLA
ncbi:MULTISPECIES: LysE family translocator [Pseudomonas syringae group]|uniref:LysE family translocator n=4 Tax=Pseudomonas syringae group TaxID=136849 RepID=A0AA40TVW0_9PSED|nr:MULTISPECIES: LysE family translocator [Pseudomonas syringae group]KPB54342.1 Lysine exporter protein LysE/YggA [Pseudomonas coronafaciens pv. oryzae]KPW41104.1 Lysine exporter protein LysE/YggA [Pseudomonas coronafaciens pv. atropurpurea]KPX33763.1 Lysine exporter protein LysE/YggA [Pseudomonas coronafaciens pv. garcae]KPY07812.1 Lysine exporter protein LysE/YggA [Pseudomonas coronafaciens pv. oryzae]KPZ04354.1 Lysine exporter protein LysE/YggA [Pseudomonas tremae]